MEVLVRTYFRDSGLVKRTQIDSYDEFVRTGMLRIIATQSARVSDDDGNSVSVAATEVVFVDDAPALDSVLGMLDGTYAVTLQLKFNVTVDLDGVRTSRDIVHKFCKFPVMVKSILCKLRGDRTSFDPGGYFVLNGSHRVVLAQEQRATNRVLVFGAGADRCVRVYSRHLVTNAVAKIEIRRNAKRGELFIYHHFFGTGRVKGVALYTYLVAVGVDPQTAATEARCTEREHFTQDEALREIGRSMRANQDLHGSDLVASAQKSVQKMLQHVPAAHLPAYAVYMARRYWMNDVEVDEEDHLKCKRFETCNKLFYDMMAKLYGMFMKKLTKSIRGIGRFSDSTLGVVCRSIVHSDVVTPKIFSSFATGQWVIPGSHLMRGDVVEQLRRECFWAQLAQCLRSTSGAGGLSKNSSMRAIHGSMMGFLCVSFTQDGKKTGISKELALFATYSMRVDPRPLVVLINAVAVPGTDRVFVDGELLCDAQTGVVKLVDGARLRLQLLEYRRRAQFSAHVSVTFYAATVDVRCDEGRILQPLVRVLHPGGVLPLGVVRPELPWNVYVGEVVEYLDADELSRHGILALTPADITNETTHLALHPIGILGPLAATVPFSNCNQAPRLTNYLSWLKQVAGPPIKPSPEWDTLSYRLTYAQRPLVKSKIQGFLLPTANDVAGRAEFEDYSCGANVEVAIMCDPNNQEDSIVVNRSAIERGLLHVTSYHTYSVRVDTKVEEFVWGEGMVQTPSIDGKIENWQVGVVKKSHRVLPGKIIMYKRLKNENKTDTSVRAGRNEDGYLDDVKVRVDKKGVYVVSIRLRRDRMPCTGDKICFRHGQKAVIGCVRNAEDMPVRIATGTAPDMLMNPHGFPTRMTMGFHLEMAAARCAAHEGSIYDATAFESNLEFDGLMHGLIKRMQDNGSPAKERMIDGYTGQMLDVCIMVAPIYAQRIKRFAADSAYARARGPIQMSTGQPNYGRERDGALRFGEMEKDCVVAHGASAFLQDRLKDNADGIVLAVCRSCGRFKDVSKAPCRYCNASHEYIENTRRAWVLAVQQLGALGIDVRFNFDC